jgi:hypothetical protein
MIAQPITEDSQMALVLLVHYIIIKYDTTKELSYYKNKI